MFVRRVSAVIIAALLGGLFVAVPAQALINDGGGGGGDGGGDPIPAAITFDDQHGTTQTIDAEVGDKMYPWSASWEGSTFTGWWTAPTGGTLLPTPIVVTGNATVYAQWTVNSYTVTFQPANGAASTTAAANYQTTISAPTQPTRANYVFAGWFTAPSDGTQVDFPYTVTGDASFYAHWTSTDITFTADPQNGAAPYATTQHSAFVIVPGQPVYAGHTFAGWWTAPTGGTLKPSEFDVDSTITVYAHWTLNSYTVTFEPGNGAAATPTVAGYGTTIVAPTQPVRAHYTLTGWFTAASGGTKANFPYTVTSDVTLFAQWAIDSNTVTFQPGNGDPASSKTADYGTTIAAAAAPVRTGYTFTGWFTAENGGTAVTFPYTVSGDATLFAQWAIDSHTVTFQPGNGTATTSQTAEYGTTIPAPTQPVRTGYAFTGWFPASSGGTAVTFPYTVSGDTTLYAHWTINSYTVTFEPGNGETASNNVATYDTTVPAPSDPSRTSYSFAGWFTSASGGTEITFPYTVTGDTTIYAQWERIAATISAPSQAAPGDTITVTGDNFIPGESVELSLHSTPVLLAIVVVGADGTFSAEVVIPASAASGTHHIEAVGSDTVTASTTVTLFAPADETAAPPVDEPSAEATDSELSSTGTNAGDVTWLALALLLGGLALTMPRALRRRG